MIPTDLLGNLTIDLELQSAHDGECVQCLRLYLILMWLLEVHKTAVGVDNSCSLEPYFSNLLDILSAQSAEVEIVGSLNTHPVPSRVRCSLDASLTQLIDSLSFYLGDLIESFAESVACYDSTMDGSNGHRVFVGLQRVVEDVFLAHCLRTNQPLANIKTLLLGYGLRLPSVLELHARATACIKGSQSLAFWFADLIDWMDAKSLATKRSRERNARRRFLHLVAVVELRIIPFNRDSDFRFVARLLRHHNSLPRQMRLRLYNAVALDVSCSQRALLRQALRTSSDGQTLNPGEIFRLRYGQH
jgi:hypothetical protein